MGIFDLIDSASKTNKSIFVGSGGKYTTVSKDSSSKIDSFKTGASSQIFNAALTKKIQRDRGKEAELIAIERSIAKNAVPNGKWGSSNALILTRAVGCLKCPYADGCAGDTYYDEYGLAGFAISGGQYRKDDIISVYNLRLQKSGCAGDILVTDNSIGVYAGDGRWITASIAAGKVVLEDVPQSNKMEFYSGCYPHKPEAPGSHVPYPLDKRRYPSTN